jgi:hypothetical protein
MAKNSNALTIGLVALSTAVLGFGVYTAWKNRRGKLTKNQKLDAEMDQQLDNIKNAPK